MGKWEDRFRERMALLAHVVWVQREVTLPSKARRIDFVAMAEQEPAVFGALSSLLHDRMVGIEHHSRAVGTYEIVRAWTGHLWMYLRRLRPTRRQRAGQREDGWAVGSRMPIMVVTANGVRWGDVAGKLPITHFHDIPGVAIIPWPSDAGVVIVDATAAKTLPGIRWALAIDAKDSNDTLATLLADTSIPVETREAVMKAIQSSAIAATPQVVETAYDRTRRLARDEGRQEGRKQGLLDALRELDPSAADRMVDCDADSIRLAFQAALARKH